MGESNFALTISTLLSEGSTANVLSQFADNRNSAEVYSNSWDLVPIIANYLTSQCERDSREVFKCCQKLIDMVAENSKPEEVLLQFIEELEGATDDIKLLSLLKPLEKVLKRLPDKRIASLAWCFNAILSYIQKIEPPEDLGLLGDERILLDSDECVNRIAEIYTEVLFFFELFVNELSNVKLSNFSERKHVVAKFLVDLLGKPLAFCDITVYEKLTPRTRALANDVMRKFGRIQMDPFVFLEMRNDSANADLNKPKDLALGIFYYLLLSENVIPDAIPKVYDPVYIFQNCLKFVNVLLSQNNQFAVENGVKLAESLMKNFTHKQLPFQLLDSDCHSTFCSYLSEVIIYNSVLELRQKALTVFRTYLWCFEDKGRYAIMSNFFPTLNHSSFKAFIVTQYKEMLTVERSRLPPDEQITKYHSFPVYYNGWRFFRLLEKFMFLKDEERTDLVEESEQIIATLNLVRYVVLADKTSSCTLIIWFLDIFWENYFSKLELGVQLSKEHYRLKIRQVSEEKLKEEKAKMSVTVSGETLGELSDPKKIEVLNLALTTLDVISCLLARVIECIAALGYALKHYPNRFFINIPLNSAIFGFVPITEEQRIDTCLTRSSIRKQSTTAQDNTNSSSNYDDEIKAKILAASLSHVVEFGWSRKALGAGASSLGYPGVTHGLFPKGGADLLHYFQKCSNMQLVDFLKELEKSQTSESTRLPPAVFVERALQQRLRMIVPYLSRWPQAIAIMSLPPNVPNALATLLTAVDDICYYAGDRSVDFNWYARRLGVAGVYKATELYLIQDKSLEHEATWQFLHRRLGEAVQIHELLCQGNVANSGPKDAITSAFVTARNILGLNWSK